MILPKFPKNCMKLKEFGFGGGGRVPLSPLRFANAVRTDSCVCEGGGEGGGDGP